MKVYNEYQAFMRGSTKHEIVVSSGPVKRHLVLWTATNPLLKKQDGSFVEGTNFYGYNGRWVAGRKADILKWFMEQAHA